MTTNTMPLSNAEKEVRTILDEAISASVTASTPGISWGKLMTVIQMQRPLVDDYISQRREVQPIQEVNIGDSVNPFRAEIVKLICALQLTGRFKNTDTTAQNVIYDNFHREACDINVSKKSKNSKWGVKHFGKATKMHEVSEESQLFNNYDDAAGGQNCGPFSFTFNVHKEEITKDHKSEDQNKPNADTASYRNDYNSYLVARYENEYGDANLLSTKNGDFSKIHDEEEEAQYAEHNMYVLKKSSTDHLCMNTKNKSEHQVSSRISCYNKNHNLQTCKSKHNGIHSDENTKDQDVSKVSQHYYPETCKKGEEMPLGANLFPTYSVICADSSSEHLAQVSHNNERDYTHNKNQEETVTDKQKEILSEVTDPKSFCELYRTKEKSDYCNSMDPAPRGNHPNNKILATTDQPHLNSIASSPSQFSNIDQVVDERKYVTRHNIKKCSSHSGNNAEYLFQNFIQPEDENNIQLLLEHNLHSGHSSPHYKSIHEENKLSDCTLEDTEGKISKPQMQENIVIKNKEIETSVLEYSSQITKKSCDSLNDHKENIPAIGTKAVLQEFQQENYIHPHLNNTSSTDTIVSNCISMSDIDMDIYECQNENSCNPFSNKKVYWSSVGLIIEDLIDSNILPVAGHSDMTLEEPQDSKSDKKSSTLHAIGSTRDQTIHSFSKPDTTDGIDDTSFISEPDLKGSTVLLEKDRSLSGKSLSKDTSDKSKSIEKSQQKKSFFKSLQRVFHLSRKH